MLETLQLNRVLYPASNSVISIKSELGLAFSNETARVQVSVDGGASWQDLYAQAGTPTGAAAESSFTLRSLSLASYALQPIQLRFAFDFASGSYYPYADPGIGWTFDEVVVTNCSQMVSTSTNTTASTNFTFTPTQGGDYSLAAGASIFTDFPLAFGPAKLVTVASNALALNGLTLSNNTVRIDFTLTGAVGKFELLQAGTLGGAWTTNSGATLSTNVAGSSYRFTTTNGGGQRFFRVQTP
jgi:hypothetical protein